MQKCLKVANDIDQTSCKASKSFLSCVKKYRDKRRGSVGLSETWEIGRSGETGGLGETGWLGDTEVQGRETEGVQWRQGIFERSESEVKGN